VKTVHSRLYVDLRLVFYNFEQEQGG
jgi:hypothetical protein